MSLADYLAHYTEEALEKERSWQLLQIPAESEEEKDD